MTYLLYGINDYLINEEIKKIIAKYEIDSDSITNYYQEDLIKDIIDDAYTMPLFSDKKLIIVNDDIFDANNSKIIENYLSKENETTILIFILKVEKLDERKKVFKGFKNKIECNKTNINNKVKEMLDGYTISFTTINKLIARVGEDLFTLNSEVEKLKLFKINDKVITDEDLSLTTKNINDNIFDFVDYYINKNTEKSLELYQNLILKNYEPIAIIALIANQIRLMYQVKILYTKGNSNDDIAKILEVHPYRVKLALEKSQQYNSLTLLNLLDNLANLDLKIKTGLIEPEIGLELFLIGM